MKNVRRSLLTTLAAASLAVLAAACGSSSPDVIDVLVYGQGFVSHGNKTIHVYTEGEENTATISTGGAWLAGTWVDVERGSTITIDYYVDVNGDSACDVNDVAWTAEREATATTDNSAVILGVTFDSSYNPVACSSF